MRAAVAIAAGLLGLASLSACGGPPGVEPQSGSGASDADSAAFERRATVLQPVDALPGTLVMEQRVTVRWEGRADGFDAVVQKRPGELLLVGLGPMQTVGFTLRLDERGVAFENRSGRELPFRPTHILADVQRVFYPWIEPASCADCVRRGSRLGLAVEEHHEGGRLRERRFTLPGLPERGTLVVHYDAWLPDAPVPARARVENRWFGYVLIVETVRWRRGPAPDRS